MPTSGIAKRFGRVRAASGDRRPCRQSGSLCRNRGHSNQAFTGGGAGADICRPLGVSRWETHGLAARFCASTTT